MFAPPFLLTPRCDRVNLLIMRKARHLLAGQLASSPLPEIGHLIIRGSTPVSAVTRILSQIEQGNPAAAELCCRWSTMNCGSGPQRSIADGKPGQTFQATALVHEAYVGLVGQVKGQRWDIGGISSPPPPRRCGEY